MIKYSMSTKYSNQIKEHIVGHIYEDTSGKLYMFLGKGCYEYNNWYANTKIGYVYLRITESKKYIKNITSFSDIIKNMSDNKIIIAEHISVLDKPKNFVKDLGIIVLFSDIELSNTYYQEFQKKSDYIHKCELNLKENGFHIYCEDDTNNICDLDKIISERKAKNKRKKFETLKKCPFCYGKNTIIKSITNTESFVGCIDCNIGFTDITDKAIIKWNTRDGKR